MDNGADGHDGSMLGFYLVIERVLLFQIYPEHYNETYDYKFPSRNRENFDFKSIALSRDTALQMNMFQSRNRAAFSFQVRQWRLSVTTNLSCFYLEIE